MRRLAIALAILAAGCPGKNKTGSDNSTGPVAEPGGPIKEVTVSWGTEPVGGPDADPPRTRVWLAVTDETSAMKSFPLGEVPASCSTETGGDMSAIGTLRCWYAGGGAIFIAVVRGEEIIVLRQWTDEEMEEPADYEEQHRVTIPAGAKVSFAP